MILLAQNPPPPPPAPPSPPGPSPQRQELPEGRFSEDDLRALLELAILNRTLDQQRKWSLLAALGGGKDVTEIFKNLWGLAPQSWKMLSSAAALTFLYDESSGDVYRYDLHSESFKKVRLEK